MFTCLYEIYQKYPKLLNCGPGFGNTAFIPDFIPDRKHYLT